MISKETAEKIWHCHREIEAAEKLLAEVQERVGRSKHDGLPKGINDVFGQQQMLQLGIPSGERSHTLYEVSWQMAEPIIKAHIADKKSLLMLIEKFVADDLKTKAG